MQVKGKLALFVILMQTSVDDEPVAISVWV